MLCDIPIEAAIDASPWLQPLATTNAHTSPLSQIVYSVLYAPFGLMEVNSPHWVFPLMVLVLFVPFYFLSVWIESGVMHRVLEPSGEVEPTISPKLRRAVGVANLLSYCFLYAVSVLWYYCLLYTSLMEKLAAEGCRHAEVFVSVGVIFWRGQEFDALFEGLERGRLRGEKDFGLSLLWIFDAVRHFGPEEGEKVLAKAVELRARQGKHPSIVGIGIGGDERIAPPETFTNVYAKARKAGLRLSVHAGESSGPASIIGALDALKAERLGHALTAAQDEQLLARLVREQVPLELCLTRCV